VLFVYAGIKPLVGLPFNGWSWRFLVFLQNDQPMIGFPQSWSLCIEEQFYFVFPVLAYIFGLRRRNAAIWLAPLAVSLTCRAMSGNFPPMAMETQGIFRPTQFHLDGFAIGLFLAATARTWRRWRFSKASKTLLAAGGLALLGTATWFARHGVTVTTSSLLAVAFGALLVASLGLRVPAPFALPLEKIALWSYGAYLWNNLITRPISFLPAWIPWWLGTFIFACATFAMAAVTYVLVEKPFLGLRAKALRLVAERFRSLRKGVGVRA
jgi:peptidoglycan/LPS O-acetylase OafA/YrhL